jgi:ATP-dependent Lhr-like helicase
MEAAIFSLMEKEPEGVGLIYIAPIKALLNKQAERLATYTEMVGLRRFVWHGDIKEPAQILMTTPESMEVMLLSPKVPHSKLFGDIHTLIVDEIHALAGTDRSAHLMSFKKQGRRQRGRRQKAEGQKAEGKRI